MGVTDTGPVEPDGLYTPEIKPHSVEKHRIIRLYAAMFSQATKRRWDCRVFLDLFAGAGLAEVTGQKKRAVAETSPLIALNCDPAFDRFIFCDADPRCMDALQERVRRRFPQAVDRVKILRGDCNKLVQEILRAMPRYSVSHTVLTLCIVDPFGMSNLKFDTIRQLNARRMDFLVLIPDSMDAARGPNPANYLNSKCHIIDDFLGDSDWRARWNEWAGHHRREHEYDTFDQFIIDRFSGAMKALEYNAVDASEMVQVRQVGNRSPLYKLALFSKSDLGKHLYAEAKKSADPQLRLFD